MTVSECQAEFLGLCFQYPVSTPDASVFGFGEFIGALALLVIVYTVSDVRYKFRVAISPGNLYMLTYFAIAVIGLATLISDVWIRERWLVSSPYISYAMLQGILGASFLVLALAWIYYAFVRPPVFSKHNYKRFMRQLYHVMLRGSERELAVISDEFGRSADSIIASCKSYPRFARLRELSEEEKKNPGCEDYAHDILLLIGNRKFCRQMVIAAPVSAIEVFQAVQKHKKYAAPLGQFAKNITTEALINKDSILYHEDEGYNSGLLGYQKPFSQALYGDYQTVDALSSESNSPLEIDYKLPWKWDAEQLEAYCRIVLITFKNYVETGNWRVRSRALYSAFENIKRATSEIYRINELSSDWLRTDEYKRLTIVTRFIVDAIEILDEQDETPDPVILRVRDRQALVEDHYDYIAEMIFDTIFNVAAVKGSPDLVWAIHHNSVWGEFFARGHEGKAWDIVRFKVRRLLYEEVRRMDTFYNYKGAKILGFCLNVMGLEIGDRHGYGKDYYALRAAVINWTKKNYIAMRNNLPDVADACLIGAISYSSKKKRLTKTFAGHLRRKPPKKHLLLCDPVNED